MPFTMTASGQKNPNGFVYGQIVQSIQTRTFILRDIDAGSVGVSSGIGSPYGSSSGIQIYSLQLALNDEPGGITRIQLQRINDTVQNGSTYLTYQVAVTVDLNSSQTSMTVGSSLGPDGGYAGFYFSDLNIGKYGGIALAGSGNILGTSARDCLNGSKGNDTIDSQGGPDYMRGGLGNDTYIVRDVNTQIDEAPGTGIETVVSYVNWDLSRKVFAAPKDFTGSNPFVVNTNVDTGLENLTLAGTDAINGTGNALRNVIRGNSANNTLTGQAGNDTLMGNSGNDTLMGGNGNDTLTGGDGIDQLNGFGTTAGTASQFDTLEGGAGADSFVLGGSWGISYVGPGDSYATIRRWDVSSDYFNVQGSGTSASQFSLVTNQNVSGGAGLDTQIFYAGDRIAIVQDSTNVSVTRNFIF